MTDHTEISIVGGTIITPDGLIEHGTVSARSGKITAVGRRSPRRQAHTVDATGMYVCPGYVDLHVHGGDGADFMDGTVAAVQTAAAAHLRHGTTTIFPTTTTGSPEQIETMLAACRTCAQAEGSTIAGVHLYGPFFAADKVGCHAQAGRRDPTAAEFKRYFATGQIAIATCAAELSGAAAFYRAAQRAGCLITCGHSNATWKEMQRAFDHGMRHVDHFWCAMSSVASLRSRLGVPMQASMAEFVLMNHEMSTEVIADGVHLSPELLEFAYRMLGADRLCLVTDANRALDQKPGDYRFGNVADGSLFRSDGKAGWALDGKSLASSVVGMDRMVQVMSNSTSASLPEVIRMATLTPARLAHCSDSVGSLEVGKFANILLLDERLRVKEVFLRGTQII